VRMLTVPAMMSCIAGPDVDVFVVVAGRHLDAVAGHGRAHGAAQGLFGARRKFRRTGYSPFKLSDPWPLLA